VDAATDAVLARVQGKLGGTVAGLRRLSGGASRVTSAFDLEGPDGARRPLILQLDRHGGVSEGPGVATEAGLLRCAAAAGVPVADVVDVGTLPGDGRGWLVVERLEGETIPRRILRDPEWADARGVLTEQCAAALASIHRIDPAGVEGLPPRDPLRDFGALLDGLGEVRPALELGIRWLDANRPPSTRRATTVHGDFRMGNLLVGPDGLRAVLDWELAHVGDPAEDLGWLCARSWRFGGTGRVGGFGALPALLGAYAAAGGAHVDERDIAWWEAYAAVKWAVICALQASAHLSGTVRSVELAAIGRRICESEWDLFILLGMAPPDRASPSSTAAAPPPAPPPFGRPTAAELIEAVRERLDVELRDAGGDRERFEARVTRNALGIAERELRLGRVITAAHAQRLHGLGFEDDVSIRAALRSGSLDERLGDVGARLAESTRDQLLVANPAYLESPAA